MPETVQTETPADRTMRRWFEGKLAERLGQAGQMFQDRAMMRRGAKKQQDGTLNQPGEPEPEDMNIRVGDEIHYYDAPKTIASSPVQTSGFADFLKKAAIAAALTAGGAGVGVGIPWLLGAFEKAAPAVVPAAVESIDTDTQYELRLGTGLTP